MKINLAMLKKHYWFEDEDGNIYDAQDALPKNKDYFTYHSIFPCTYTHEVDSYTFHPEHRHENNSLYQALLHFKPFRKIVTKLHKNNKTFKRMISMSTSFGNSFSQDCVVAMVNSGEYTLEEAIYVYCNSCERCMNVLLHKYLNGKEGYEEHSEEWEKCGTICEWCKDE